MPKTPRVKVSPVVATVMEPVAMRLHHIENLVLEMRGVIDVHLKRIGALQAQVDLLTEKGRVK
jgi:hypothetical protein